MDNLLIVLGGSNRQSVGDLFSSTESQEMTSHILYVNILCPEPNIYYQKSKSNSVEKIIGFDKSKNQFVPSKNPSHEVSTIVPNISEMLNNYFQNETNTEWDNKVNGIGGFDIELFKNKVNQFIIMISQFFFQVKNQINFITHSRGCSICSVAIGNILTDPSFNGDHKNKINKITFLDPIMYNDYFYRKSSIPDVNKINEHIIKEDFDICRNIDLCIISNMFYIISESKINSLIIIKRYNSYYGYRSYVKDLMKMLKESKKSIENCNMIMANMNHENMLEYELIKNIPDEMIQKNNSLTNPLIDFFDGKELLFRQDNQEISTVKKHLDYLEKILPDYIKNDSYFSILKGFIFNKVLFGLPKKPLEIMAGIQPNNDADDRMKALKHYIDIKRSH